MMSDPARKISLDDLLPAPPAPPARPAERAGTINRLFDALAGEGGEAGGEEDAAAALRRVRERLLPPPRASLEIFYAAAAVFSYAEGGDPSSPALQRAAARARGVYPFFELHDRDRARAFIARHFEAPFLAAFDVLWHPALRGDYFRLLKLFAEGRLGFAFDETPLAPLRHAIPPPPEPHLALGLEGETPRAAVLGASPRHPVLGLALFKATHDLLFAPPVRLSAAGLSATGLIMRALAVHDRLRGKEGKPAATVSLFKTGQFFVRERNIPGGEAAEGETPPPGFFRDRHTVLRNNPEWRRDFAPWGAPFHLHLYGEFVEHLHRGLLGRDPDPEGFATYAGALWEGADPANVIDGIASSTEHRMLRARRDFEAHGYGSDRPCPVFLHIEKTAGTSLTEMLARSLPGPAYIEKHDALWGLSPCELEQFDVFAGHFNFDTIGAIRREKKIFAFLRDPRERLFSAYNFWRCHPEGHPGEGQLIFLARAHGPEEFFTHPEVMESWNCWNHMTWCIFGNRAWGEWKNRIRATEGEERRKVRAAFAEAAALQPEKFFFIGFTHDFINSWRRLARLLDLPEQEVLHTHSLQDLREKEGFRMERRVNFDPAAPFLDPHVELDQILFETALRLRPGWAGNENERRPLTAPA